MNAVIYKYTLSLEGQDIKEVVMPVGANVLTVKVQGGTLCLWALVPAARGIVPDETRRFLVVGTGQPFPEHPERYIGTVQLMGGALVLHVFDLGRAR